MTSVVRMAGVLFRCEYWDERLGEQCGDEQLPESKMCVLHAPVEEMKLPAYRTNQVARASYKYAAQLPETADALIAIALDPAEAGATRVRAIEAIQDRSGLPRTTQANVDVSGGIDIGVDVRASFQAIQDRVAKRTHEIVDAAEDEDEIPPPPTAVLVPIALPEV